MSCPMTLAKPGGQMNSAPKADLANILICGISVPTEVPVADKTCVLTDGHALIQTLGKPHEFQTFADYVEVLYKQCDRPIWRAHSES